CLAAVDLKSVVVTTFLEGCIGETVAAVEAREAARCVFDPVLERALAEIAADESRHAALGWRFVSWALRRAGNGLVERLRAELARAQTEARLAPTALDGGQGALEHGLLPPAFRAALRQEALASIVAPCLEALVTARLTPASRRRTAA